MIFLHDIGQSRIVSRFLRKYYAVEFPPSNFSELRQVLSTTTFKKAKMSQLKKRIHLFNCDNTYKLEPVEKLLEKFVIYVERVEKHYFRLPKMSEMVDKIPTLDMDMAFFVVHAHECVLSINEDDAGIGYAKIYRSLLQATGKEQKNFQFF